MSSIKGIFNQHPTKQFSFAVGSHRFEYGYVIL